MQQIARFYHQNDTSESGENMICNINDAVLYGLEGICWFAGISEKEINGKRNKYYVLRPVYNDKSTIFVPVDNEKLIAKIRRVLSVDEIHALIKAIPNESTIWIEDDAVRREQYKKILARGDRTELVRLIKTLYLRQQSLKEKGRKMPVADERFIKDAEKLLHDEFAHVLNIDREQILPLILEQIQPCSFGNL